jgi:S1-C subfamily serine protease
MKVEMRISHLARTILGIVVAGIVAGCASTASPPVSPQATIEALSQQLQQLQERNLGAPTSEVPGQQDAAPTETTLLPAPRAPAAAEQTATTPPSLEQAAELVRSYTVFIETDRGYGSGVWFGDGQVVTNHHVIDGAAWVWVMFADRQGDAAKVEWIDATRDLALLLVSTRDRPAATLADSRALRPAQSLLAVGYPRPRELGFADMTVTSGIFSRILTDRAKVSWVQSTAPINPGNSGGPLADASGRLVGVNTGSFRDAQGLNLAVASEEVEAFLARAVGGPPRTLTPRTPDVRPPAPTATPRIARPQIVATETDASLAEPGTTFRLQYTLLNDGNVPARAVLGASIRPAGGGPWINDPANDTPVSVRPGRAMYSRTFRIPVGTTPGDYDVAWGLFSEDQQTGYGLETQRAILTVTAAGGTQPPPQVGADPAETVRRFYARVDEHDIAGAWDLLSERFRRSNDFGSWEAGYATTRAVRTLSATTEQVSATAATVRVSVRAQDESPTGLVSSTWQGTWELIRAGGEWRLDRASITRVG